MRIAMMGLGRLAGQLVPELCRPAARMHQLFVSQSSCLRKGFMSPLPRRICLAYFSADVQYDAPDVFLDRGVCMGEEESWCALAW
jgi:hypothetical protein